MHEMAPNPVVSELWRGEGVESMHRGCWVLVDATGDVVDHHGDPDQLVYGRSSTKSIQALPLIESGAADALGVTPEEVAVAVSSHNGEPIHVAAAGSLLHRAGLTEGHLRCGRQLPRGAGPNVEPTAITNECSGKHAGFLAASVHLGDDVDGYLSPTSDIQQRVHAAVVEITGADPASVTTAADGCSAPTFRLPLRALATGLARMANPRTLPERRRRACERIVDAVSAHPELVAGTHVPRFDTEVIRATSGRLFAKGGAEAVQTIGLVGEGLGFAAKIDDGSTRPLSHLTLAVLVARGLISPDELSRLTAFNDPVRRNRAGLDIGRHQITQAAIAGTGHRAG